MANPDIELNGGPVHKKIVISFKNFCWFLILWLITLLFVYWFIYEAFFLYKYPRAVGGVLNDYYKSYPNVTFNGAELDAHSEKFTVYENQTVRIQLIDRVVLKEKVGSLTVHWYSTKEKVSQKELDGFATNVDPLPRLFFYQQNLDIQVINK